MSHCASTTFEKTVLSIYELPLYIENQLYLCGWVYLWIIYSVPMVHLSILMSVSQCLDDCCFTVSLVVVLTLQICSSFLRLPLLVLVLCNPVWGLKYSCRRLPPKIPSGIFSELVLILQVDLGRTDMVTLLYLLTNERGISLCLFKSLISLNSSFEICSLKVLSLGTSYFLMWV